MDELCVMALAVVCANRITQSARLLEFRKIVSKSAISRGIRIKNGDRPSSRRLGNCRRAATGVSTCRKWRSPTWWPLIVYHLGGC